MASSSDAAVSPAAAPPPASAAWRGAAAGLAAAALFGLSAPLAKLLLREVAPLLLAGLLYAGAAAGLGLHRLLAPPSREARIGRGDLAALATLVLAGGVVGPVLMLLALQRLSAVSGALLLNLEAPLTMLLAVVVFGEHLGRWAAAAAALIVGGAALLQLQGGPGDADPLGAALMVGACACWALDNNLTQRLTLRDPFALVRIKTLAAGAVNCTLAVAVVDQPLPPLGAVAAALLLGSLSYGASVVLDAYALRWIGAAREAAYFATAPFVGALAALALFDEALHARELAALAAMALGVAMLLAERHLHLHHHEALEHEHLHRHDAHHQHAHDAADPPGPLHSHRHRHAPLVHAHAHLPDAHHRHRH